MHKTIVKNFIFPWHEKMFGRQTMKCLRELEQTQWYSQQQIRDLQMYKLKELLEHAYRNVPYYRTSFGELRFVPSAMSGYEDFRRLPLLDKKMPRTISQDWDVDDDVSAEALDDINEEFDEIYDISVDRLRVFEAVS